MTSGDETCAVVETRSCCLQLQQMSSHLCRPTHQSLPPSTGIVGNLRPAAHSCSWTTVRPGANKVAAACRQIHDDSRCRITSLPRVQQGQAEALLCCRPVAKAEKLEVANLCPRNNTRKPSYMSHLPCSTSADMNKSIFSSSLDGDWQSCRNLA